VLVLCTMGVCAITACGPSREPFLLRAVVAKQLQSLSAERPATPSGTPPELETRARTVLARFELEERSDSLFAEARDLGEGAIPFLEGQFRDRSASLEHRALAASILGVLRTEAAADAIVRGLEEAQPAELRAKASIALAVSEQPHVVPTLLEQIFVESDPHAARDIAFALCLLGNYSNVARLRKFQSNDPDTEEWCDEVLRHAKSANPSAQWDNLQGSAAKILDRVWSNGDPQRLLSTNQPTPRQRLEVWKRIRLLSTRATVDADSNSASGEALDSREREARRNARRRAAEYALENGAPWTADLLALALHDEDRGVRAGAAQALGRMSWRAHGAWTVLVAALDEPTIAADAARALGEIGEAKAINALLAALASDATLVRTAAAEALGNLGATNAIEPLRAAIEPKEPVELRIAAICALSRLGCGDEVESAMIALLENAAGDLTAVERELEARLVALQGADRAGAKEALNAWRALAPPPHVELDARDITERWRARARVLRMLLPAKSR